MQNIFYLDNNFVKENSIQYILSIRFSTDGLSFACTIISINYWLFTTSLTAWIHKPKSLPK